MVDSAAPVTDQLPVQLPELEPERALLLQQELAPQLGGDGIEDAEDAYHTCCQMTSEPSTA